MTKNGSATTIPAQKNLKSVYIPVEYWTADFFEHLGISCPDLEHLRIGDLEDHNLLLPLLNKCRRLSSLSIFYYRDSFDLPDDCQINTLSLGWCQRDDYNPSLPLQCGGRNIRRLQIKDKALAFQKIGTFCPRLKELYYADSILMDGMMPGDVDSDEEDYVEEIDEKITVETVTELKRNCKDLELISLSKKYLKARPGLQNVEGIRIIGTKEGNAWLGRRFFDPVFYEWKP